MLVYVSPASAALTCAAVPAIVTVPEPLPPIVAPPPAVTLSVPLVTVSVVVRLPPSTSLTVTPAIAVGVSSTTVWPPGTVLTGASLTGVMLRVTVAVLLSPFASV